MSNETRIAVINLSTNLVENVAVVADGDGSKSADGYLFSPSDDASIGDGWDGQQIIKAAQPEPDIAVEAEPVLAGGGAKLDTSNLQDQIDVISKRVAALEAKIQ